MSRRGLEEHALDTAGVDLKAERGNAKSQASNGNRVHALVHAGLCKSVGCEIDIGRGLSCSRRG